MSCPSEFQSLNKYLNAAQSVKTKSEPTYVVLINTFCDLAGDIVNGGMCSQEAIDFLENVKSGIREPVETDIPNTKNFILSIYGPLAEKISQGAINPAIKKQMLLCGLLFSTIADFDEECAEYAKRAKLSTTMIEKNLKLGGEQNKNTSQDTNPNQLPPGNPYESGFGASNQLPPGNPYETGFSGYPPQPSNQLPPGNPYDTKSGGYPVLPDANTYIQPPPNTYPTTPDPYNQPQLPPGNPYQQNNEPSIKPPPPENKPADKPDPKPAKKEVKPDPAPSQSLIEDDPSCQYDKTFALEYFEKEGIKLYTKTWPMDEVCKKTIQRYLDYSVSRIKANNVSQPLEFLSNAVKTWKSGKVH